MKCDMKTMLKAGLGLVALIAVVYILFPGVRELLLSLSPVLFLLLCPLMMLFMMKGMQSCHKEQEPIKHEATPMPVLEAQKERAEQR